MRTYDVILLALHVVLDFKNISGSNLCMLQWSAAVTCFVFLGLLTYNQLS